MNVELDKIILNSLKKKIGAIGIWEFVKSSDLKDQAQTLNGSPLDCKFVDLGPVEYESSR